MTLSNAAVSKALIAVRNVRTTRLFRSESDMVRSLESSGEKRGFAGTSLVLSTKSMLFNSQVAPSNFGILRLKPNVSGCREFMLRNDGDENSIEAAAYLAVVRFDLHRIPLARWVTSAFRGCLVKGIFRLGRLGKRPQLHDVESFDFEALRPDLVLIPPRVHRRNERLFAQPFCFQGLLHRRSDCDPLQI